MNYVILRLMSIDLVIILAAYLFVFHGETGAGVFIIGQGLVMDVLSGGMFGLFTLLYLIVFLCIKLASRPLDLMSTGGLVAMICMATILKEMFLIMFLYVFSQEITLSVIDILFFILSAICSGIIAPLVFYCMNILDRLFIEADGES